MMSSAITAQQWAPRPRGRSSQSSHPGWERRQGLLVCFRCVSCTKIDAVQDGISMWRKKIWSILFCITWVAIEPYSSLVHLLNMAYRPGENIDHGRKNASLSQAWDLLFEELFSTYSIFIYRKCILKYSIEYSNAYHSIYFEYSTE